MKSYDLIEAMGQIDDRIIMEVVSPMKQNGVQAYKSYKRIFVLAAAFILMLSLGIAAYATNLFGLRVLLRKDNVEFEGTEYSELSLSQPQDVPEEITPDIKEKLENSKKAWAEWDEWRRANTPTMPEAFVEPDGADGFNIEENDDGSVTVVFIDMVPNGDEFEEKVLCTRTASAEEYRDFLEFMDIMAKGVEGYDYFYYVETPEMGLKLEEIAQKYGLSLRRKARRLYSSETTGQTGEGFLTNDELAAKTAEFGNSGNIFRRTPDGFDKVYWFEEGTFAVSYYIDLPSGERVNCYGYNSMYSTLSGGNEVINWESDLSGFTERTYTTADGTEIVILSDGGNSAYIYVYLENSFFAEHVHGLNNLSDTDLNSIADLINYSLIGKQ